MVHLVGCAHFFGPALCNSTGTGKLRNQFKDATVWLHDHMYAVPLIIKFTTERRRTPIDQHIYAPGSYSTVDSRTVHYIHVHYIHIHLHYTSYTLHYNSVGALYSIL